MKPLLYRIKPEFRNIFNSQIQKERQPLEFWKKKGVEEYALHLIGGPYITFGHVSLKNTGTSMSGWSDDMKRYYFTIQFQQDFTEHLKSEDSVIHELIDEFEEILDKYSSRLSGSGSIKSTDRDAN